MSDKVVVIDAHNLRDGGGVTHLVHLLRHARWEHLFAKVHVLCGSRLHKVLSEIKSPVIQIHYERDLDRSLLFRLWWLQRVLPGRLREFGANLLFSPGGLFPKYIPDDVATVTMCRNMLPFQQEEIRRYGWRARRFRLELLKRGQGKAFSRADGVIFLSQHALNTVTSQLKSLQGRSVVIPHGISDIFRGVAQKDEKNAPSVARGVSLLYVSTIDFYKHQDAVLKGLHVLRKKYSGGVHLTLVGNAYPAALDQVKRVIKDYDLAAHVTLRSAVPYEQLPLLYSSSDVSIFASSCENCPNTLLEMMAAGVPIACSSSPPMPEFAGDSVEYFDVDNPDSIAGAVENLLANPVEAAVLASRASSRAGLYTWPQCAESTGNFLYSLLTN